MIGLVIFMAWQFEMSSVNLLPAYGNIIVTIITTLFAVAQIYEGKFWNKCIFTIAFNAIWMLIETISGNILLMNRFLQIQTEITERFSATDITTL